MIEFIDARDTLPRHPSKRWQTRDVSRVLGFVWHHTAGGDNPEATARYHVGASHTSADGMPGIAYTFYVRQSGEVWWCNDLAARTWSQGGGKLHPDVDGDGEATRADGKGDANGRFIGIVFGGNFDSRWNPTGKHPTPIQILAGLALVAHLTGTERHPAMPDLLFGAVGHLTLADVWAHADFGKAACPGDDLSALAASLRHARGAISFRTDADWQRALSARGYDLGPSGADGVWGPKSRAALEAFQRDSGLDPTGHKDPASQALLFDGGER